jgi:acyl carrier protein
MEASCLARNLSAIREIIAQHGRLSGPVDDLNEDSDLYDAGLTSLATVGVMLALEEHFDVEFPEILLARSTFQSMGSIARAVARLTGEPALSSESH